MALNSLKITPLPGSSYPYHKDLELWIPYRNVEWGWIPTLTQPPPRSVTPDHGVHTSLGPVTSTRKGGISEISSQGAPERELERDTDTPTTVLKS